MGGLMKFCSECGTKLPPQGAKFCPEWGLALQSPVQSPDPSPAPVDPTSREGVDLYNAGLEAGRQGNHAEATRCFGPLAESGDPQSAEVYAYSLGMLGRHVEALPWLEKAAQVGLFSAASRLAADAADKGDSFRARQIFAITAEAGGVVEQAMPANLCNRDRDFALHRGFVDAAITRTVGSWEVM